MGAQLDHRGDADQAQGDGAGEHTFIVVWTKISSKRISAMEVILQTKVSGKRLQLSGFYSLLIFRKSAPSTGPVRGLPGMREYFLFCYFLTFIFSSADTSTSW